MPLAAGRPSLFQPGWIVFALFTLNPVWWLMGFGGFTWSLAFIPLWGWILLRRDVRWLPTLNLFVIYIGWALLTIIRLDRATRYLSFSFRYTAYLTALGLALYVFNERRVTRATFIRWVSWLWVAAVIGGYLGILFPNTTIRTTIASTVLPGSLTSNDFVGNLVRPGFAQVQTFLGFAVPRPKTLFPFTNEWGGNVGLLTPFFIASFVYSSVKRERSFGMVMLLVAVPPMILSLNRGLWLSLALTFGVMAYRSFLQGRTAPLKVLIAGVVVVGILVIATPLRQVVESRLSESDAETREGLYQEAWEGAKRSPILGYGGPRPSINPFSPSIGTHGHVWLVMFSHGFVGLGLYLAWIVGAIRAAIRPRDQVSLLLACVVIVGGAQMFFYNLLPISIPIVMTAFGLLCRPADDDPVLRPQLAPLAASTRPSAQASAGSGVSSRA